ncbi:MAG: hypothetical protein AMXMBFR44_2420 [Candidatus Campbellbacteria bacterium]
MYIEVIGDTRNGGDVWAEVVIGEWSGKPHLDSEQATIFYTPLSEPVRQVLDSLGHKHIEAFEHLFLQLFRAGMDAEHDCPEIIQNIRDIWELDAEQERERLWQEEHRAGIEYWGSRGPNTIEKDELLGKQIWQGLSIDGGGNEETAQESAEDSETEPPKP